MNGNTNNSAVKVGVIFLGRKRPGFDMEWGQPMAEKARAAMAKTGFSIYEPPQTVTDDASLKTAVADCSQKGVDAIVTLQTTMADMRMAPTMSQIWPHPVIIWATPENPQGDMISSCSLVGVHAWASILQQINHPFEIVYGDPDDAKTMKQFNDAVRLAHTHKRLHNAFVGIIGTQAPGFFAMGSDPFTIRKGTGAQLKSFTLLEFADVVNSFSEKEVAEDVAKVKAMGMAHKDTTDDDLPMASRLYLALRHYLDNENIDALSFRCWPEMPNTFGQWPYVAMARLTDEGKAIGCEGDVDGSVTALAGESLGLGPSQLSDWLEHDDSTITIWHAGTAPFSLTPPPGEPGGPQIACHFNNKKPAVIESSFKVGLPVTLCRMWHTDGTYKISACDAETVTPRRHLMGTNGLAKLKDRNPDEWFRTLCDEGMPHHLSIFAGHHSDLLQRLTRTMRLKWVE